MSLLLAALKKSEENGVNSRGLTELKLEEIQTPPSSQTATLNNPLHNSGNNSPPPSSVSKASSMRANGENLFSSKIITPIKRLKPGIISIALIAGLIFAVAGSIYVYYQTAPTKQRPIPSPPPLPVTAAIVIPPPAVNATAPVPLVPLAEVAPAVAPTEEPPISSDSTRIAKTEPNKLNIRHQQEADAIDPILASAYQAYQNGNYATAEQRYRNALTHDENNRDALLGLAAIAQQQGQEKAALQYYRRVLLLDPRDAVAHAALAALGSGDAVNKESDLKQLIALQPDSAALHFALGNQLADQSRWAEAQQAYFDALAAEPNNALFAFNLAISLDHLGQRVVAAQHYRQALQLDTSGNSGFARDQAQQRLNQLTSPVRIVQ